jgi:hypothetical protein
VWLILKDQRHWYPEQNTLAQEQVVPSLQSDDAVRTLLNVSSVGGAYRLPEGENFGVIALLWFENGKFRGRPEVWQLTASPEGTRAVAYQIVWGKGPEGEMRMVEVVRADTSTLSGSSRKQTEQLLSKLDGNISTTISGPSEEVRGYRMLACILSKKTRPGGKSGAFGSFAFDLENRETVAVIGVKTFPTKQQMFDWMEQDEPADP